MLKPHHMYALLIIFLLGRRRLQPLPNLVEHLVDGHPQRPRRAAVGREQVLELVCAIVESATVEDRLYTMIVESARASVRSLQARWGKAAGRGRGAARRTRIMLGDKPRATAGARGQGGPE